MSDNIGSDMLKVFTKGKEKYLSSRSDRFTKKTTRISNVIHRSNLKTMKTIRSKPEKTIKKTMKQMNIAERNIEIARERGVST